MGLDNGIIVRSDKRELTRQNLPIGIEYPFDKDYNDKIEIAYWRKCWGLRNQAIRKFGWKISPEKNESSLNANFMLDTPEQVLSFIEFIASWLDKDKWEEQAESIWEYDEIRHRLIQQIINLSIIYTFMLNNPDIYLEFYDSY